ncbi:MAG: hypothetical protein COS15_03205 [Caldiserica bacterium CG02_land_8_20_14_3_00_36_38]|jgi:uncharacterized membrane protein YesL|nr:hypothetical protein [Caldisericota bacterium]OIP13237.1 MAG: hypothetical protein AUJ99_02510 [Caldisericum sp. CG2_30_36_11]PIV55649.1 MAG: hypothetical protein COS15_03205 [Caldiserica bacterium CG02_land_8_20_14_3_00_36_38]PIW10516.1 MAG: hypothetical protein COW37_03020 [Caldiserica bacterium CG17_big_fil_post_rev_8_21_14_2_50_35_7]
MNKEEQKKIQLRGILFGFLFIILSIGFYLISSVLNKLDFYWYFLFPALLLIFAVFIPISIFIANKSRSRKK